MNHTVKKEITFSDSETYAINWVRIQGLIHILNIISDRKDEWFAEEIKESVKFLENVHKQL